MALTSETNNDTNGLSFDSPDFISKMPPVRKWLLKQMNITFTKPASHLATVASELFSLQGRCLGPNETKISQAYFLDANPGGGLCKILMTVYKHKKEQHWWSLPRVFQNKNGQFTTAIVQMLENIKEILADGNMLTKSVTLKRKRGEDTNESENGEAVKKRSRDEDEEVHSKSRYDIIMDGVSDIYQNLYHRQSAKVFDLEEELSSRDLHIELLKVDHAGELQKLKDKCNRLIQENTEYRKKLAEMNVCDENGRVKLRDPKDLLPNGAPQGLPQNIERKNRRKQLTAQEKLARMYDDIDKSAGKEKKKRRRYRGQKKCSTCNTGTPKYCLNKCGHTYCAMCLINLAGTPKIQDIIEIDCKRCKPSKKGQPLLLLD